MSSSSRKPPYVLVLFGTALAIAFFVARTAGRGSLILLAISTTLALLPPVNRRLGDWLTRGWKLTGRARVAGFIAVAIVASLYLVGTALRQHRPLVPLIHDEFSYLLQARMLAQGHLYQPQHALADFFETFHVLVKPVYASIYFPGTAIFYVPAIWLHWNPLVWSAVIYGLIIAMTWLITAELVDDLAGLIAALLLLATPLFRSYSICVLGQGPASLLGLMMIWEWMQWRRQRSLPWALLIGLCAGWAAITRPVDALAFATPIGVAMLLNLWRRPRKQQLMTAAIIVAGAAPFLALQAHFDRAVTGSALQTPYVLYLEQSQPGSTFGFRPAAAGTRPISKLPQKQAMYDILTERQSNHRWRLLPVMTAERLAGLIFTAVCSSLLVPLAIVGLIVSVALPDHRWRVIVAIPVLFFALYLVNPYFLQHYAIPTLPMAAMAVVLGIRSTSRIIHSEKWRHVVLTALTLGTVSLAVAALPEFDRDRRDEVARHHSEFDPINQVLRTQVKPPAVVLFRYAPPADCLQEPVYNIDVVWPDDAPIIRAQDLGARDREIGAYYAARQPRRHFYLYERGAERLYDLGTAADVGAGRGPAVR